MAVSRNNRIGLMLAAVVPVMLGLSYAAVPLYNWFCAVTGYGGTTAVADHEADRILDRVVSIRFDANTAPDMPWEFRPVERTMKLRIGESGLAFYEAYNPTDEPIAGRATFNVAPYSAGPYFTKVACFCFDLQVLQPGERVEMPVSFYVDPAMVDDGEASHVTAITLSYTMFREPLPEDMAKDAAVAPATRIAARPVDGETKEQ